MATHKVKQGEDLDSIAFEYRLLASAIWQHENNRNLREKREDPNVLRQGDEIFIPDKECKEVAGKSGARHKFQRKGTKSEINLQLVYHNGEPRAGVAFTMRIKTRRGNHTSPISSTTDDQGFISVSIPANTTEGELILNPNTDYEEVTPFRLGHMDPAREGARGIQAMLNDLGYYCGEEDDEIGELTWLAVREFQEENSIEPFIADNATSIDPTTADAIREEYLRQEKGA